MSQPSMKWLTGIHVSKSANGALIPYPSPKGWGLECVLFLCLQGHDSYKAWANLHAPRRVAGFHSAFGLWTLTGPSDYKC